MIVIPDTQSQEKKDALRLLRRRTREVPAVPYKDPNNYVKLFRPPGRGARQDEPNGAIWANQFDNVANRQAPYRDNRTGNLGADGRQGRRLRLAVGTGGTLAGVSDCSRRKNKNIRIALADPLGAALYSYYKTGELKAEGTSITEGIGQGRVTRNLEGASIDDAFEIPDVEACRCLRLLRA